jgi:hypothetical protein
MKDNADSLQNAGMSLRSGASASLQKGCAVHAQPGFSDATSSRNDPSPVRNSARDVRGQRLRLNAVRGKK